MVPKNIKELKNFLMSGNFNADDLIIVEDQQIKILKRSTATTLINLVQFLDDIDNENYRIILPPVNGVIIIEDYEKNQYPICIDSSIEGIKDKESNKYVAFDYVEYGFTGKETMRINLWRDEQQ